MLSIGLFDTYVATVLLSAIVLSVFVSYYVYKIKPYSQLPSFNFSLKLVKWLVNRRNDVPFQTYVFKQIIEGCKKYQREGLFVFWSPHPIIFVYGEEITKMILNEPAAIHKPKIYDYFKFFIGSGIFTSNGEDWKKHRKVLYPAFHGLSLKSKVPLMNEKARELVHKLYETKESPRDDVTNIVKFFTFQLFFEATFGEKPEEIKRDSDTKYYLKQIYRLVRFASLRIFRPWYQWDFLLYVIPEAREMLQTEKELRQVVLNAMKSFKTKLQVRESDNMKDEPAPNNNPINFIKHRYFGLTLINEHLKNPEFTVEDAYHQFVHVTVGGFETTAYGVMWTLFMLGLHPDVQEQAYNEITSATTEEEVKYEDIKSLDYLDCIVKETLRIYPVAPLFGRRLTKDLQCGKTKIPKDSEIVIFIYMVHRNPSIFPDPEKFDPERFKDPAVLNKPWAHIPFAESLRPCVGKSYAMMQMKILLCHILRKFKVVSLDRREDIDKHLSFELIMTCLKYPRIQFIPR